MTQIKTHQNVRRLNDLLLVICETNDQLLVFLARFLGALTKIPLTPASLC